MVIASLTLENFRNYRKRRFEFSPQTNLIVGPNTSGKTNLLEALFLLASGSSPRATLDREMVREGEEFALVSGRVGEPAFTGEDLRKKTLRVKNPKPEGLGNAEVSSLELEEIEVQLIASKNSPNLTTKRFKINGVGKRLADFLSEFHVVLFSPEDLNLVTGTPDLRRRFLDFALANVDPRYRRAATEYEKVRRRRNRLLEKINAGEAQESELGFWDAKLLEFGTFLQDARKHFFDELNPMLHNSLFILQYLISGLTAERLYEYRPREIAAETTLIGPHRDDFCFLRIGAYEDRMGADKNTSEVAEGTPRRWGDLAKFGSRSEQRRAVLALKKAELEFVERKIGDRPVLLLDDIFSELDEENRSKVSSLLNGGSFDSAQDKQVIITTADIHHIPEKLVKDISLIELK